MRASGNSLSRLRAVVIWVSLSVKGYVKENWGAPFVLGFIFLLMGAAVSLLMGYVVLADELAAYGYYSLVVGVVLQLGSFLKYNKREEE